MIVSFYGSCGYVLVRPLHLPPPSLAGGRDATASDAAGKAVDGGRVAEALVEGERGLVRGVDRELDCGEGVGAGPGVGGVHERAADARAPVRLQNSDAVDPESPAGEVHRALGAPLDAALEKPHEVAPALGHEEEPVRALGKAR